MSAVYIRDEQARTTALARIRCSDEIGELHKLLLANPALLVGDQIDPDLPRRWLLVKHEMPVPDPSTGVERWSIDFFYVDQLGVPTLVECKRTLDTRSRREVVAQMLEYAASGQHYWTKSDMRSAAETSAGGPEKLQRQLNELRGGDDQTAEEFFATVEQNLREAKMRLIFFLEESPNELRSLVDFLNKQLTNTEVFIVEARQYQHGADRVVVPWVFGFTEEARVAKRESRAQTVRAAGERGQEAFWQAVDSSELPESTKSAMRQFVAYWETGPMAQHGYASWGANSIFVLPHLVPGRGLFSLTRNGALEMYFGYWDETKYSNVGPKQIAARDQWIAAVERIVGVSFDQKQRRAFPKIPPQKWIPVAEQLQAAALKIGNASS